jgi:hypothetical protein
MDRLKENCIEWLTGQKMIAVTLSQKKYINRVRSLVEKYAEMGCELVENRDGSVFAKLPLSALHLYITTSKNAELCGGAEEMETDDEGDL